MKDVYVLMDGCTGDEGIEGIYTSEEKANEAKKKLKNPFEPWIEEWELDNEDLQVFDRLDSIADPKEFIGHIETEGDRLLLFKSNDTYCLCQEEPNMYLLESFMSANK